MAAFPSGRRGVSPRLGTSWHIPGVSGTTFINLHKNNITRLVWCLVVFQNTCFVFHVQVLKNMVKRDTDSLLA